MNTERELPTTWSGDPSKFEAVYREHAPRIRTFLRQLVGYPQAAEDLTQEIFTQLWQRPNRFDPTRGTLRAYLFGVARNRSIDWWRQTRPEEPLPEANHSTNNPERDLIIADALQRLPQEQRALLWLREVEGQSYAELATILNIPLGTVRSRLFAARQSLRMIWLDKKEKEICMRCDELQEFVSAMYDGEAVPPEAAEHLAHCAACQELFQSFVKAGAELRRFGALQIAEPLPERSWVQRQRTITAWWEKGWQMMKVPRIVFASLALLLLLVGSRLALVEVRAHDNGSVLLLKIGTDDGSPMTCPLSATDRNSQACGGFIKAGDGSVSYLIRFLKKDGDRALLSLRSQFGRPAINIDRNDESAMPETQVWVTAGEAADTSLGGVVKIKLTGQWTDHIPVSVGDNEYIDPSANELRLASPLLLKNDHVVGDMEGATAYATTPQRAVTLYIPGEGRFILSSTQISGSIAGKVMMNRISFTSDGYRYVIVTGAPVARGETVWVKHESSYKPPSNITSAFLGAAPLNKL